MPEHLSELQSSQRAWPPDNQQLSLKHRSFQSLCLQYGDGFTFFIILPSRCIWTCLTLSFVTLVLLAQHQRVQDLHGKVLTLYPLLLHLTWSPSAGNVSSPACVIWRLRLENPHHTGGVTMTCHGTCGCANGKKVKFGDQWGSWQSFVQLLSLFGLKHKWSQWTGTPSFGGQSGPTIRSFFRCWRSCHSSQAIDKRHQAIPLPNSSVKQSGGPLFVHLWVGNSSWPEAVCQAGRWAQKVPPRSTTLGFPSPWIQSPAWCLCQVCRKGKPCCFELEANEPVTFQFWHDLCVNMWMETVGDWKAARCGDWVACCVWSTQKPKALPFLPRSLSSSLWSYPLFWMSNQSVCLSMFHNKEAAHKCHALMLAIQMNSWWSSGSNSFAIHTEPLHVQNQDSSIDQNSIIIIHVYNHW